MGFALFGAHALRAKLAIATITRTPAVLENLGSTRAIGAYGIRPSEAAILRLLDVLSEGASFVVAKELDKLDYEPGILLGTQERLEFQCNTARCLSYYLEFLLMIAPFSKFGVNLVLHGVTDSPTDISVDALKALTPSLMKRMGLDDLSVQIDINARGVPPGGGGSVSFSCQPLKKPIQPMNLAKIGKIARVRGTAWSCNMHPSLARKSISGAKRVLLGLLPDVWIAEDLSRKPLAKNSHGYGLTLVAESYSNVAYASSAVSLGEGSPEGIGELAVCRLLATVMAGGTVDASMQWMPLYYMALSDSVGVSTVSSLAFKPRSPQLLTCCLAPSSIGLIRLLKATVKVEYTIDNVRESSVHEDNVDEEIEKTEERNEREKPEVNVKEQRKEAEGNRVHCEPLLFACVGVGLQNLARSTF